MAGVDRLQTTRKTEIHFFLCVFCDIRCATISSSKKTTPTSGYIKVERKGIMMKMIAKVLKWLFTPVPEAYEYIEQVHYLGYSMV